MAFGFFKKREYADQIFSNGIIYTMDPNQPEAEAVACKCGEILAVGDFEELESLVGDDTQVIDLEGKVMFPGFIKLVDAPAQTIFSQMYRMFPEWSGTDLDSFIDALSRAIAAEGEKDTLFFYGGSRPQLAGLTVQQVREAMDAICADRPVAVLFTDCSVCLLNTFASDAVKAAAEEDGVSMISLDYILSVIAPPDWEQYLASVIRQGRSFARRGFTTVNDCSSFDYPQALYRNALQELLMEEQMDHRYLCSYLLMGPENQPMLLRKLRQRQTECLELQDMIRCDGIHICIKPVITAGSEEAKLNFEEETLSALCVDVADIGCQFMVTAHSQDGLTMAAQAVGAVRDSGYKKNAAILVYDDALSEKEMYEFVPKEEVFLWGDLDPSKAGSVKRLMERLTIDAADALGMMDRLGSIQKGMAADFTVLQSDPYKKKSPEDFYDIKVAFTVVDGHIISHD